jgi:hypothetical protein
MYLLNKGIGVQSPAHKEVDCEIRSKDLENPPPKMLSSGIIHQDQTLEELCSLFFESSLWCLVCNAYGYAQANITGFI